MVHRAGYLIIAITTGDQTSNTVSGSQTPSPIRGTTIAYRYEIFRKRCLATKNAQINELREKAQVQ